MLIVCRVKCFFILVCTLKVIALAVVWILSICNPLFAAWSAFLLPSIPVWAGIQLILGISVNLDATFLMSMGIVFRSSFILISINTTVKEYMCIVILSLVSLASSIARRMAVISLPSTDTESLSLMIIYSSLCTTASVT